MNLGRNYCEEKETKLRMNKNQATILFCFVILAGGKIETQDKNTFKSLVKDWIWEKIPSY